MLGGLQEPSAKGTVSYASMMSKVVMFMCSSARETLLPETALLLASLAAAAVAARAAALGESGAGVREGEGER